MKENSNILRGINLTFPYDNYLDNYDVTENSLMCTM